MGGRADRRTGRRTDGRDRLTHRPTDGRSSHPLPFITEADGNQSTNQSIIVVAAEEGGTLSLNIKRWTWARRPPPALAAAATATASGHSYSHSLGHSYSHSLRLAKAGRQALVCLPSQDQGPIASLSTQTQ